MSHQIVSISLEPEMVQALDRLQSELGVRGRSELVRIALKTLLSESKQHLADRASGILLVVHEKGLEASVTGIKHDFEDIISTQLHANAGRLKQNRPKQAEPVSSDWPASGSPCFEVFVVEGHGTRIHEMLHRLQSVRNIGSVKLVLA